MSESSEPSVSIAVIAACAGVGGLIVIFLVFRIGLCIRHRRQRNSVPLPPARPLAALHTLPWSANPTANASTTNFSSSKLDLSTPTSASPTIYHSEFAMMQHADASGRARNIYRQYSGSTLNTEEMPLKQPSSPITRVSTPQADGQLVPPQPSFFASQGTSSNRSSAQLSLNSSTEESDITSYPPQRHQSVTAFPIDPWSDDQTNSSPHGTPPPLLNSSPRMSGVHSRRVSVAASVSTIQTTRSMRSTRTQSTVRGPPHKPFSRVEIVLPAPLAPPTQRDSSYLHDLNERNSYAGYGMSSRQSVCDPWLKVGRENTDPVTTHHYSIREGERRHRTVSSESQSVSRGRQSRRVSVSSVSSFTANGSPYIPSNPTPYPSRSSSVSSQSRATRTKPSVDLSELPPVPRVPSIYTNPNNSPSSPSPSSPSPILALSDSITGNGTLRGLASDSTILKRSLPSKLSLKPPEPKISEEGRPDSIPVEA
ncbi:hypothetical protein ACEPAI_797 [Sanghuangporus weigelae]